MALAPFHLAIPVFDLAAARHFYAEVFGLEEGRSSEHWVDFNFFGHQLVIHEHPKTASQAAAHTNAVDGHDVPVPHFGVVLGWEDWHALVERLQARETKFVLEPHIRFKGQVGTGRQFELDRVSGPDFTAGQNDAHDSGFADQLAIAVAIQCGIHQSGLDLVELGARVAQSGDLDDGVPAEMQASAGRQPEQIDAGCRHVFAHLAGG